MHMHHDMEVRKDRFDSDFTLKDLLTGSLGDRLAPVLTALLASEFRLISARGDLLMGKAEPWPAACRCELRLDIEPLGYLEAPAGLESRVQACADALQLLLKATARYLMASHLHEENVSENYQRLQQEHAALLKSELRYKQLAEELEARVSAQVETIKHAERQLYQAEKMASVGQLAAGIAHEINNPIGFVRSNLGTARSYVQLFAQFAPLVGKKDADRLATAWRAQNMDFVLEDFASLLDESIVGADRVARIVADLKGFSDIDRVGEHACSINDCVESVCNVAASHVPAGVRLVRELADTPPLHCHPGQLNQALLSLLLNAVQAVNGQGEVVMKTMAGKGEVLVQVSDNGDGIAEENLSRIFEPFFTTREVGQGSGLGLTVCRDIIRAHGGTIEVQSRTGEGACFTVRLPVEGSRQ